VNAGGPVLEERLGTVRAALERAAARAGRVSSGIRLVAAVKGVAPEQVRRAVDLGVTDLGENRVQEAETKIAALGRGLARWHLIGHLQRNKAGRAVELFDEVHTIDRVDLAESLARRVAAAGRTLPVLVEVNVAREASKHGAMPDDVEELVRRVAGLPGLELRGLMTVGPRVERPQDARAAFAGLRELRDRVAARAGLALPELSMGMSDDFEVAIEEGATQVRVGSALFGPRD
jgi:PLP dependent protein